jgi:hypothetical protein
MPAGRNLPELSMWPACAPTVQEVLGSTASGGATFSGAHEVPGGALMVIYDKKQWFTPCAWNDGNCTVSTAVIRAHHATRSAALTAIREDIDSSFNSTKIKRSSVS